MQPRRTVVLLPGFAFATAARTALAAEGLAGVTLEDWLMMLAGIALIALAVWKAVRLRGE